MIPRRFWKPLTAFLSLLETTTKPDVLTEEQTQEQEELSVWARLWGSLWALVVLVAVFSFWQNPYHLTLISAFRFQLFLGLIVLSVPPIIVFPGKRKLLFVAVPLMFSLTFASYLIPVGGPPQGEQSVSVALANIYSGNRDLSRFREWLKANPSDVVGVLEVSEHHIQALQEMGFEHMVSEPRENNFGLALLSKQAPLRTTVLGLESPFPSILAEFDNYQVLLCHPPPPVNVELREVGDIQVEVLLNYLESSTKPVIFMGDLNATGWDLRVFPLKERGYKDARRGFGMIPTWPTASRLLQIPIDHIFVPEKWTVNICERGPEIGSDHFPLRAVLTP
jgi:endonuclease/exonuclease/phosphatase (EEP) superfamily protein YafD